ncbi:ATP-binding protein [Radicibacter daui]|uniref:ATP-binding protein n=1 Tax=Radicibacter daui TaxID=3064829 RepID=UPI004046C072
MAFGWWKLPRTIRGQLLLVLLVALVVTITSISHLHPWGPKEGGGDLETVARRLDTVATLLGKTPPTQRGVLLEATRQAGFEVELMPLTRQKEFTFPPPLQNLALTVINWFFPLDGAYPIQGWRTYLDGERVMAFVVDEGTMLVLQGLPDGIITEQVVSDASNYFLAYMILVVFCVFFAVTAITRPLRRISEAASKSDIVGNGQIFDENGPEEIASLARALNGMRSRIRMMVDTRTRMLRGISHDLRTPLTRLRLRADTMREGRVQDGALREDMLSDIDQIDSLLTESLNYLRDDYATEGIVRTDVASILQTVCSDFSDVGFNVYYSGPNRLIANCKPLSITRAVTNLCDNAMKFASEACVELAWLGQDLSITVVDNGPGVPEHLHARLFEPFFKADDARTGQKAGFGLGLSIVADIVEAHHGQIELLSRQPHGLQVRITFPRTLRLTPQPAEEDR